MKTDAARANLLISGMLQANAGKNQGLAGFGNAY
jgi:hypothetical protein